jgi:hypothetical protein
MKITYYDVPDTIGPSSAVLEGFAACGGFTSLQIHSLQSLPPFFQSTHPPTALQYLTHPTPTPNLLSNNITTHHCGEAPLGLNYRKSKNLNIECNRPR